MIVRNIEHAAKETYDVIIVGGGIYGAMLALEATARGLRPLLVENHDFGSQTSFNSFRLLHGGLRYLQSMDIIRLRESGDKSVRYRYEVIGEQDPLNLVESVLFGYQAVLLVNSAMIFGTIVACQLFGRRV